jgi:hypothetical protein
MKKITLFVLGTFLSIALMAQNQSASKIVNGNAFQTLTVTGPVTVELIESDNPAVHAEGSQQFMEDLLISWSKKKVTIVFTPFGNEKHLPIKVFAKGLKNIEVENGAQVITPSPLNSPNILLTVNGVNGESMAKIVNYGKIRVISFGNVKVERSGKQ